MSAQDMPPHDLAAEQAVLGGMMLSAAALGECLDLLTPAAFFRPAHQIVFEVISALANEGEPVDVLTVKAEIERRGEIARIGGAPYLHTIIAAVPAPANAAYYAREALLELQARRDLQVLSVRVRQIADAPDLTRAERLDRVYAALDEVSGAAAEADGSVTAAELIGPYLDSLEHQPEAIPGVPSGWHGLDELIPGFRPGEVTIIGARPGMGKSVILLNVAAHTAIDLRRNVLAVTLEMSRAEYMERLLAQRARVDLRSLRDRKLSADDWARIAKAAPDIYEADTLAIHDGPELSVQGIRAELRAMRRAGRPADLVTVDYLTLVEPGKADNRQLEVAGISRKLKLLAKEFNVPVMVAAALNRGPEMRSDHLPVKADLRDSGTVEQDSDIVILLYRDDEYREDSPRSGEIDLIVAKNRQGPKSTVTLAFQGHYATVADMWNPSSSLLDGAA